MDHEQDRHGEEQADGGAQAGGGTEAFEPLTPNSCRVLGSLLEKELTVPSTYPMTLNALVTACNQSSGRNPVLALTDAEVTAALDELRRRGLTRVVHASHGARTTKYRQVAHEALGLDPPDRAVLTLLLLRGAQTPGELRTRSDRLHTFATVDDVLAALAALSERRPALVVEQPRNPGQKEARWSHRLAGDRPPAAPEGAASTARPSMPQSSVEAVELHPQIEPLRAFLGRWEGAGAGEYPTIESFAYAELIELQPVAGKPIISYRSSTLHPGTGMPMHSEAGWLRPVGDDGVELVVAQGPGLVEVAEGVFASSDGGVELILESLLVAGTSSARTVTATERRYRVTGDRLEYELAMASGDSPLTHHLRAALHRL